MPGRNSNLMVFLVAAGLVLYQTASASAHALEAQFRVLSGQKVRVEAWFETDDPASGAKVKVFRSDKTLLIQGKMDDEGVFVFSFKDVEPLEVVIDDGQGHGAKLAIAPADLNKPSNDASPLRKTPPGGNDATPSEARPSGSFPWRDVLLGITFLLAVAAFVLSLRNAQALRKST